MPLQRALGNHESERSLLGSAEAVAIDSDVSEAAPFAHDFSRIPVFLRTPVRIQAKRTVNPPSDIHEQEADRIADQMMATPDNSVGSATPQRLQRYSEQTSGPAVTAPASVERVLASPGRPLDSAIRKKMERNFGQDFSGVRLHSGVDAAQSARELNANAYTAGRHIVFGAGRFVPGTPAGERLIAHELTHVLQQRTAPYGVQRKGPEGETRKPATSQPAATQPAPSPPPLTYDRDTYTLKPLPDGFTLKSIQSNLTTKIAAGDLKSATASGVTSGSTEDIFVLYVIWALGTKSRWGTEADIVTAIGWPPKPGDPAPLGRITLRIDDKGAATAALLATGPVPPAAQTTVAVASPQLIADYGFKAVRDDGTAAWADAEISDVSAALAMVPASDKKALKGVELIRVKTIAGGFSGEFSTGGGVAKGATTVTALPSLKLADLAFPATQLQFFGDKTKTVPASFQTILHEVGHAVENETYRTVNEAYDKAILERNKKVVPQNESYEAIKKVAAEYDTLYKKYQAAKAAGNTTLQTSLTEQLNALNSKKTGLLAKNKAQTTEVRKATATRDAAKAKVDATRVPAPVVAPFKADAAAKKSAADAALAAARPQIKALPAPAASTSAAYMKAVEDTAKAIASFVKDAADGAIGPLEDTVPAQDRQPRQRTRRSRNGYSRAPGSRRAIAGRLRTGRMVRSRAHARPS